MENCPPKYLINLTNFPPAHVLYDNSRKRQLGLLKSETAHLAIKEVIGLNPKAYSILSTDQLIVNLVIKSKV